jgi:hypothetical protein
MLRHKQSPQYALMGTAVPHGELTTVILN